MDVGGLSTQIRVREARKEDAQNMLKLYNDFAQGFVGPASRTIKIYRRMLRRKERVNLVALNRQGKMVGYASSRFDLGRREARIEEIVAAPDHDFEKVAKALADRAYNTLAEKKPAAIIAGSLRNPEHERIFTALGFLPFESTTVFMCTILNTERFLNELVPIFASRLKRMEKWSGSVQIKCDEHNIFIQKAKENVEHVVWTNQPIDFKVALSPDTLLRLIFGVADPLESLESNKTVVETTVSPEVRNQLLRTLFPRTQFFTMDYW